MSDMSVDVGLISEKLEAEINAVMVVLSPLSDSEVCAMLASIIIQLHGPNAVPAAEHAVRTALDVKMALAAKSPE